MDKKLKRSGLRKRGRPAGKQRIPLTLEERRARNAQYERERRVEMSEALADLAAAAGCEASMSNAELLATVVTQLQRASKVNHSTEMESLKRSNEYYLAQIADLEQRLTEPEDGCPLSPRQNQAVKMSRAAKRKRSDSEKSDENTVLQASVPESSPEHKYTPPLSSSPEPSAPLVSYPEQQFKHSPEPEPQQHDEYFTTASKLSRHHEHCPLDSRFSAQHSMPNALPVPKLSPMSHTSEQISPVHGAFDYSEYRFASAETRTPEYLIISEPTFVPVGTPSPHEPVFFESQFLPQQYPRALSPSQYVVHEAHYEEVLPVSSSIINQRWSPQPVYEVPVMPSTVEFPVHHNVVGSVEVLPAPVDTALPTVTDVGSGASETANLQFMSYNDMIALYL